MKILIIIVIFTALKPGYVDTGGSSGKKLSAKEAFFKAPFSPCKGSRPSTTVEVVQAHVFATRLFNEIGLSHMIQFAKDYKVPAFAIYPMANLACYLHLLIYGSISKGSLLLSPETPASAYTGSLKRFYDFLRVAFVKIVVRHSGQNFTIPWGAIKKLFDDIPPFMIKIGDGHPPRDVNFILHAVEHFRNVFL